MQDWILIVGPERTVEILGVRLVGVNAETGTKVLFTIIFVVLVVTMKRVTELVRRKVQQGRTPARVRFWGAQGIKLATAVVLLVGLISIWFDDPTRLTTGLGLITAGLAFALQRVVTALAGYFVILRGSVFNVGDRIVMGGVRGDVIALDFTKTTIMEMGQPPPVQGAEPPIWVQSREYTGRVVTVTNAKIFDEPVYNYTRDFPYLWEELSLPISYDADHERAERLLLDAAERHTVPTARLAQMRSTKCNDAS
jgi:small-conductance mechanosensitive channel